MDLKHLNHSVLNLNLEDSRTYRHLRDQLKEYALVDWF